MIKINECLVVTNLPMNVIRINKHLNVTTFVHVLQHTNTYTHVCKYMYVLVCVRTYLCVKTYSAEKLQSDIGLFPSDFAIFLSIIEAEHLVCPLRDTHCNDPAQEIAHQHHYS